MVYKKYFGAEMVKGLIFICEAGDQPLILITTIILEKKVKNLRLEIHFYKGE